MARDDRKSPLGSISRYMSLAFLLPACVVAGYGIGHLLDRALGTHFLYIVFLLLGIAAGFVQMIRMLQEDTRRRGE